MTMTQHDQEPRRRHSLDSVKTWRYLRLSMVVVVAGLAAAVLYEHFQVRGKDCFQTSISAYYYTPARSVLVVALVSIAVAMLCLRGNTPTEDLLLNLAGMFAPVVAFVPTLGAGTCWSVASATEARAANIANNLSALLTAGALALAFALWRAWREPTSRQARIALTLAITGWAAVLLVHDYARDFFDRNAHGAAATAMFVCIIGVACINVREFKRLHRQRTYWNRYAPVAGAMLAVLTTQLVTLIVHWTVGTNQWSHQTIVVEGTLLLLFAVFWVVQTCELWDDGLRPCPRGG
jgi:hypothetical protein